MVEDKPSDPLQALAARLRAARERSRPSSAQPGPLSAAPGSGLGMAFRIGVELVAALVVGVGIGLLLDRWLGTAPWFLVVFFFLGAAAGVVNVYRAASGIGLAPGYGKPPESEGRPDNEKTDGAN